MVKQLSGYHRNFAAFLGKMNVFIKNKYCFICQTTGAPSSGKLSEYQVISCAFIIKRPSSKAASDHLTCRIKNSLKPFLTIFQLTQKFKKFREE